MASIPLSPACCSTPFVVAEGYEPKGQYGVLDGRKTYVTGSTSSKTAILFVYDVYGFANQSLQGADILAKTADTLVLMPDFLDGGVPRDTFPPNTPEKQTYVANFFAEGGIGNFIENGKKVKAAAEQIKSAYPSVESIGAVGFCWGGKAVILAAKDTDVIKASAQAHPTALAKEDAEGLKTPHLILASKDEDVETVKAFDAVPKPAGSETHTYPTVHHGWMGARARLNEPENFKEYQRGYQQLSDWFSKVLA